MGLRDRLRLLVKPPAAAAPARPAAGAPPMPPAPPALRPPAAWSTVPVGATVVDVGQGPLFPGARRLPPDAWGDLRGTVVVVGGEWAAAAAERIASYGRAEVGWLVEADA